MATLNAFEGEGPMNGFWNEKAEEGMASESSWITSLAEV